jgi:serine/alanine adding enzyme
MTGKWQREILTTDDRGRWRLLVEAAPCRDAFFAPEYVIPFERLSGETAYLFFFGDEANYVVYPFFRRRINDLPFYRVFPLDGETAYFDIVSPYGYSGPLECVDSQDCRRELWRGYLAAFHQYCQENRIVCEFARLNPFVGNHRLLHDLTDGIQATSQIVYVDLTRSEAELWRGLNRGNRSNINKARRSGVTAEREYGDDHLGRFYELYTATMRRNHASQWYFFSPEFFVESFALLDTKISLFCARYHGQIVAAASFLHDGAVVHYFLGGSDGDYLALRPNNLLMYEAICWAKRQGYRRFNLGGGYRSQDSLTRFKAAFSKLTTDFYTYRVVHDAATYDHLCQRHATYQMSKGHPDEPASYFPRYRAGG